MKAQILTAFAQAYFQAWGVRLKARISGFHFESSYGDFSPAGGGWFVVNHPILGKQEVEYSRWFDGTYQWNTDVLGRTEALACLLYKDHFDYESEWLEYDDYIEEVISRVRTGSFYCVGEEWRPCEPWETTPW